MRRGCCNQRLESRRLHPGNHGRKCLQKEFKCLVVTGAEEFLAPLAHRNTTCWLSNISAFVSKRKIERKEKNNYNVSSGRWGENREN